MIQGVFLIKRLLLLCSATYFVLFLNGCSKTQYEEVWDSSLSSCSANCHSPEGTGFGLEKGPDMSSKDKFYANVVGKTVATDYPEWLRTGDCDSVQLIKTGDATNSLVVASLVQSVADTLAASENCTIATSLHTQNKVTVSETAWADLVKWINDGAPKE